MAKSNGPQLTLKFNSDTKGFSDGIKKAKQDLKDFEKTGKNTLTSFGDTFGVPIGKIEQMMGSVRELGRRFSESENAGTKAFGKLLQGCTGLKAGLAGLGIGAAIAAFKALKSEADNFSNTIDGLNLKLSTQAWIDTYKQALHDSNRSVGEYMAGSFSAWRKQLTEMGGLLGNFVANGFSISQTAADVSTAKERANIAEAAASDLADAQKKLLDIDEDLAALEAQIATARQEAYDTRDPEAVAYYIELINKRYNMQEPILREIYKKTKEINDQASDGVEDIEKQNAAYRALANLTTQRANDIKSIQRLEKSVTKEVTTQVEETDKWVGIIKDLQGALAADRADLNFWGIEEALNKPGGLTDKARALTGQELVVPVKFDVPEESITDFSANVENLLTDALTDLSTILGNAIGDALSGGDVWGNFSKDILGTLADICVKVGEIAVAVGVAILGIKAALKSLNPFAAIGAGVALIALGSAAKAALSNAADRAGSSAAVSSSVASSSYGSGGVSNMETANITVNVTGRLQASGSTLVAVLDSENNRRNHTT